MAVLLALDEHRPLNGSAVQDDVAPTLTSYVVPAHELQAWWPQVRPALERVREKNKPSWIPEDVYHVLAGGRAALALTFYGQDVVGVTVVCQDGDQFAHRTDLLVWIAWADPENVTRGIAEDVRAFTQAKIEEMGRAAGFRILRMHSPRKGWLKVAKQLGYELQEFVFYKRL